MNQLPKIISLDFRTLRALIDECLGWASGENVVDPSLITQDREIILAYFDVLKEKAQEVATEPVLPEFRYRYSLELMNKTGPIRARIAELREKWLEARGSKEMRRNYRDQIKGADETITQLEIADREKQVRVFTEQCELLTKKHREELKRLAAQREMRARIVQRLERELSDRVLPVGQKISWRLLPPGPISLGGLRAVIEKTSRISPAVDFNRIEKILGLKPDEIYYGLDEFDGYFVFYFKRWNRAVLDSQLTGNAIYIFGEDWKQLSTLTKTEVLAIGPPRAQRIIHRGEWLDRLSNLLRGD